MNKRFAAAAFSLALFMTSETATADNQPPLPAPIGTVITVGQSNCINEAVGGPYKLRHAKSIFQLNIDNGKISPASDPLRGIGDPRLPGLPVTSYVLPLADLLMDAGKFASILVAPICVGDTISANWAEGGTWNGRVIRISEELNRLHLRATMILWMQGEGDASTAFDVSMETYEANVRSVQETFAAHRQGAPFFVPLETVCFDRPNPTIRGAQAALVDYRKFFPGPDFDTLLGSPYRQDVSVGPNGCHFSQVAAWNNVAPMWAGAIKAALH